jgi:hypothetical protein
VKIMVRDARGRLVPLLDRRALSLVRPDGPIPLATRAEVRAEEERTLPVALAWTGLFLGALVVLLVPFLLYVLPAATQGRGIGPFFTLVPLVLMLLAGAVAEGGVRFLRRGRTAAAVVRHGHCAACGYALLAVQPGADGCRVCPECGAAWRVIPRATGGEGGAQHGGAGGEQSP